MKARFDKAPKNIQLLVEHYDSIVLLEGFQSVNFFSCRNGERIFETEMSKVGNGLGLSGRE